MPGTKSEGDYMKRLLISFSLLMLTAVSHGALRFIVVIDAGSTGSRVHLFSYKTHDPLNMEEYFAKKVHIPLATEPKAAIDNIMDVLKELEAPLAANHVFPFEVPVFLNATAGMRLLSQEHQDRIYTYAKNQLPISGYDIREARTISGDDEALYDWLAVNYLVADHFNNQTADTLDLGGASVQLTHVDPLCSDGDESVQVGGHHFCIQPTSYLGLGLDEAFHHASDLSCFPTGYTDPHGKVSIFGHLSCRKKIDKYLAKAKVKSTNILKEQEIDAISAVYYTVDFFHAYRLEKDGSKVMTVSLLKEKLLQYCSMDDWQTWREKNPDEPLDYLERYCFAGIYLESLIGRKVGFNISQSHPIRVWKSYHKIDMSWPLGAAIRHVYMN